LLAASALGAGGRKKMRGLATDITPSYGDPAPYTRPVVALIAGSKTDPGAVEKKVRSAPPGTLWVLRGKPRKGDPIIQSIPLMEYVILENDKRWGKFAEDVRNTEILEGCSRVIVFHTPGSITDWFAERADLWPNLIIMRHDTLPSS
jgi:hypothetical protein